MVTEFIDLGDLDSYAFEPASAGTSITDTLEDLDESGLGVALDAANRSGLIGSWLDNVPDANNSGRAYEFDFLIADRPV